MESITFVEVVVALVISAALINAYRLVRWHIKRAQLISDNIAALEAELEAGFRAAIIRVIAERHDGVIFFYEADTNQYLCRGQDLAELEQQVTDLFPGKMLVVDDHCDPEILAELGL